MLIKDDAAHEHTVNNSSATLKNKTEDLSDKVEKIKGQILFC